MLDEKAKELARKLVAKSIRPLKFDKWSEFGDPCIWITESIYIQVGIDYVMVFRDRPVVGLAMYEASDDVNDVIAKLRQAIDEGK